MIDPLGPDPNKPNQERQSSADATPHEDRISRPGKLANDRPFNKGAAQTNSASTVESEPEKDKPSGFRRALGAARSVLPAILPLLEGNVAAAAANLLTSGGKHADLSKIENALARLRAEQGSCRGDLSDYKVALKQLDDQLRLVKEATDQSALQQQRLEGDLHSIRRRFAIFAWISTVFLIVAISMDVYLVLYLHNGRP